MIDPVSSHGMNAPLRGSAAAVEERGRDSSGRTEPAPVLSSAQETFCAEAASKRSAPWHTVRVRDVMTPDVRTCRPDETLAAAGIAMNRADCRFLPVVDASGRPVGVITDGDICILGSTDHRPLRSIPVREAMSRHVTTCGPDAGVLEVVGLMRGERIRHVPVVDAAGVLVGVVSLTDLVVCAEERGGPCDDPICHEIAVAVRAIAQKHAGGRRVEIRPFTED